LDDILVIGKTQEEHDQRLEEVLKKIRAHGLSLNSAKCKFSQNEVHYLGHLISQGQIRPDPDRTQPIRECPQPTNLTELERFLGMASYFRSFIPNFAQVAHPLYVMKRYGEMKWSTEEVKAFQAVKNLISEAVVDIPSSTEKLRLRTDASNCHIAAFLENEKGRPVSFASRLLSETEKNYDVVEKEALAIFWSITCKFRWLLIGREFEIFTDHKPLIYLLSTTKVSPKIIRWRLQLQEFQYTIHHCAGSRNVVADSLSRAFVVTEEEDDNDCDESPFLSESEVLKAQKADIECRIFLRSMKRKEIQRPQEISKELWSIRKRVRQENGILTFEDEQQKRWILPNSLRKKALKLGHDNHRGIESSLARLRRHFYWPNLRNDLVQYVKSCRICSLVKPKFVPATLTPLNVKAPLEIVALDYIGPLPTAEGNLRYLLVFIDLFSRFPEVYPCSDMSTTTLISKTRDYFSHYGFPDAVLSDQGSQFESQEFRDYLRSFSVKKLRTTAYHPQCNGLCEKFNRTIQQHILSLLVERNLSRSCWSRMLPTALLSYRTTPHRSTGHTPAELFLGFSVKTFAQRPNLSSNRFRNASRYMDQGAKKRKVYFDRKAEDRNFHNGQKILIRMPDAGKFTLKGKVGTVEEQINKSVVEVNIPDQGIKRISTSRISPIQEDLEMKRVEEEKTLEEHKEEREDEEEEKPEVKEDLWRNRLRPRPPMRLGGEGCGDLHLHLLTHCLIFEPCYYSFSLPHS
jgi:transposase InsO family protein